MKKTTKKIKKTVKRVKVRHASLKLKVKEVGQEIKNEVKEPKTVTRTISHIRTPIDDVFSFIEDYSPVKESKMPKELKGLENFDKHIRLLEDRGMIEVKLPLFSTERIFVFKSRERSGEYDPWVLKPLSF